MNTILAAGEVGTWEFDVIRNVVHADKNLAKMFGVPAAQAVVGTSIEHFLKSIHPDDLKGVEEAISRGIEKGTNYEAEYRIIDAAGLIRWVAARGKVERDADGRAVRLPGVIIDITGQRKAEEALRLSDIRWRLALDAGGSGAFNIDVATETLHSDERFRQIFQGTGAPLTYEEAFRAIHPGDRERIRMAVAAAVNPSDPAAYAEEYRVIRPDWSVVWVYGKGRANFDGNGLSRLLVSFDGTVTDITERKNVEDALREIAAQLSEADRKKNEFLATLAHELRNPLAPIRTGLEVMRMAADDAEMVEKLRLVMETQTQQLVRLIDDLLDISRITSGKIELRKERMDLNVAVQSAIDSTSAMIEDQGHVLVVTLPEIPVNLEADFARISQIIANLLTNASRYTEPPGKIWLELDVEGSDAVLRVRDTGIGIPPEMLEQIFEMFSQADRPHHQTQGGLGIGLTLVKRLTEMHSGTVEARSEGDGKGSEFLIRLPLASGDEQPTLELGASRGDSPSRRILVVDDNRAAAETLALSLTLLGNDVRQAYDGVEAVKEALRFRPEVILMDIGMPRMNGYEAAREMRKHDWGKSAFLVALTGWGQEDDRQRTSEAGFDRHVVKPVEPAHLDELLRASMHSAE